MAIDSAGRPLAGTSASIVSPSTGYMLSAPVKPDGSFVLANIAPGEYGLAALVVGPGVGDLQQVMLPITITGDDVAGLVLQMTAGSHVTGRIVSEEGTPLPSSPAGMRVDPLPMPTDVPIRIQNIGTQGIVNDDWTFEMKGLGGTMLFRPSKLPAGYMLKSVLLDGRDVADTPVDIRGTEDLTGLQVVVTSHVTEINGAPCDAKGLPVPEYTVVAFAEDAARWRYPSRFLATARPDQQGRFKIANLPPGRYLAVARQPWTSRNRKR